MTDPKGDCRHRYAAQTGGHHNDCPACAEEEARPAAQGPRPARPEPLPVSVGLQAALDGLARHLGYEGAAMLPCPHCNGLGEVLEAGALMPVRRTCPKCRGAGRVLSMVVRAGPPAAPEPREQPDPYCLPDAHGHIDCPQCAKAARQGRPQSDFAGLEARVLAAMAEQGWGVASFYGSPVGGVGVGVDLGRPDGDESVAVVAAKGTGRNAYLIDFQKLGQKKPVERKGAVGKVENLASEACSCEGGATCGGSDCPKRAPGRAVLPADSRFLRDLLVLPTTARIVGARWDAERERVLLDVEGLGAGAMEGRYTDYPNGARRAEWSLNGKLMAVKYQGQRVIRRDKG